MTLSALAPTCSTALPNESVSDQARRIAAGIETQLAMPGLATVGLWRLAWLALSEGGGNLAYLAIDEAANAVAVVLRGTTASLQDAAEDLKVWSTVPFPECGSADVRVSEGALEAFEKVTSAPGQAGDPGLAEMPLRKAVGTLLASRPAPPALYVTGHSLGGALATTVGLYLEATDLPGGVSPVVWTFAAPTAGAVSFQTWYDQQLGASAYRTYNAYDLVPLAWENLPAAEKWYPAPGPVAPATIVELLAWADDLRDGHVYAQPTANPHVLNDGFTVHAPATAATTYVDEVAFQHHARTYLTLLGAPVTPAWPAVGGVSPRYGPLHGGNQVTVVGTGFEPGAVVYFGARPGTNVDVRSDTLLTVDAPSGFGPVDVRVTTFAGTSGPAMSAIYTYL